MNLAERIVDGAAAMRFEFESAPAVILRPEQVKEWLRPENKVGCTVTHVIPLRRFILGSHFTLNLSTP